MIILITKKAEVVSKQFNNMYIKKQISKITNWQ